MSRSVVIHISKLHFTQSYWITWSILSYIFMLTTPRARFGSTLIKTLSSCTLICFLLPFYFTENSKTSDEYIYKLIEKQQAHCIGCMPMTHYRYACHVSSLILFISNFTPTPHPINTFVPHFSFHTKQNSINQEKLYTTKIAKEHELHEQTVDGNECGGG